MDAYLYDAIRTPRGKGKNTGSLYEVKPVQLLAGLMGSLAKRNHLDTSKIDDCVIGCVSAVGEQGGDIGKIAAIMADWDESVPGVTLNRFCGSGLEALNLAAMKVKSGWEDLIVAGGVESMSRVPMGSDGSPWALDPETNLKAGFVPQGISADLVATMEGISRETVDHFALESHRKALNAVSTGRFSSSIIPVVDQNQLPILDKDETIRSDTDMEALGQLKPSFSAIGEMGFDDVALRKYLSVERINHIHTPGNSSGIVDGAGITLIGNETVGRQLKLEPRARFLSTAVVGTEPTMMLTGPAPAVRKALAKADLHIDDIDLFEVNEAFAAVVIKFMNDLNIPSEKINVNGGAIAMGHPLGATGAMLLGTLLDELERQRLRYGMCTLCIGAGMGIATIIERL